MVVNFNRVSDENFFIGCILILDFLLSYQDTIEFSSLQKKLWEVKAKCVHLLYVFGMLVLIKKIAVTVGWNRVRFAIYKFSPTFNLILFLIPALNSDNVRIVFPTLALLVKLALLGSGFLCLTYLGSSALELNN